jgi:transcriptional regulator with XRE-family HTH domain
MNSVGERIRRIRQEKKISGTKVAQLLGITPQYYYDIEKGKRNLSAENASKIAKIFNVSVDYLLGRSESIIAEKVSNYEIDDRVRALAREIQDLNSGDIDLLEAMIKTMRERGKEARNKE